MALFLLQVDIKPLRDATVAVPAPKIAVKRKAEDADASKDLKKVRRRSREMPKVPRMSSHAPSDRYPPTLRLFDDHAGFTSGNRSAT